MQNLKNISNSTITEVKQSEDGSSSHGIRIKNGNMEFEARLVSWTR